MQQNNKNKFITLIKSSEYEIYSFSVTRYSHLWLIIK